MLVENVEVDTFWHYDTEQEDNGCVVHLTDSCRRRLVTSQLNISEMTCATNLSSYNIVILVCELA